MADIGADGPFSAFPGIERWFAVLTGAGVALSFAEGERPVLVGDAPLRFDGGAAPGCRLLGGPTRDLNLMAPGGRGHMQPVAAGAAWDEPYALRGFFTAVAGRWSGSGETRELEMHTLLWDDSPAPAAWRFEPGCATAGPCGWWLGLS